MEMCQLEMCPHARAQAFMRNPNQQHNASCLMQVLDRIDELLTSTVHGIPSAMRAARMKFHFPFLPLCPGAFCHVRPDHSLAWLHLLDRTFGKLRHKFRAAFL